MHACWLVPAGTHSGHAGADAGSSVGPPLTVLLDRMAHPPALQSGSRMMSRSCLKSRTWRAAEWWVLLCGCCALLAVGWGRPAVHPDCRWLICSRHTCSVLLRLPCCAVLPRARPPAPHLPLHVPPQSAAAPPCCCVSLLAPGLLLCPPVPAPPPLPYHQEEDKQEGSDGPGVWIPEEVLQEYEMGDAEAEDAEAAAAGAAEAGAGEAAEEAVAAAEGGKGKGKGKAAPKQQKAQRQRKGKGSGGTAGDGGAGGKGKQRQGKAAGGAKQQAAAGGSPGGGGKAKAPKAKKARTG